MLFLGLKVLVLLDMQYLGRFWTSYEAFLSMQTIESDGCLEASKERPRVTICCYGAAAKSAQLLTDALVNTWGTCTVEGAYQALKQEDIVVTNMRDKEQQLQVLVELGKKCQCVTRIIAPERDDPERNVARKKQEISWMPKNYILHKGFLYATLCDSPIDGDYQKNCSPPMHVPKGWEIAPNCPDSAAVAKHGTWSCKNLSVADGSALWTKKERCCGSVPGQIERDASGQVKHCGLTYRILVRAAVSKTMALSP